MNKEDHICGYSILEIIFSSTRCSVFKAKKHDKYFIIKIVNDIKKRIDSHQKILREYEIGCKMASISSKFLKPVEFINTIDYLGIAWNDKDLISLKSFTESNKIDISLFFDISIQIIEALHTLHSEGIIHRDLSLNNILYNKTTKYIYLSDFGATSFWREFESNILPSKLGFPSCGTFQYLSPEHTGKVNRPIDYRSDLYSLGIIFYELLLGCNPYSTITNRLALLYTHVTVILPPLHTLTTCGKTIPIVLSYIISKLLKKSIHKRYQSCLGLLYDINQCKQYSNLYNDSDNFNYIIPLHLYIENTINNNPEQLLLIQEYQKILLDCKTDNISSIPFILGSKDKTPFLLTPCNIYGRDTQLNMIKNLFTKSLQSENKNTGVIILGYSGSGKTAIINKVLVDIKILQNKENNTQIIVKTKFPQFTTTPFNCIIFVCNDILSKIVELDDNIYKKMQKKLGLKNLSVLGEQLLPRLKDIYDLQVPEVLPAVESLLRLQDVTCKWISFICSNFSLLNIIIYFDDIQWADQNSISMIKSFLLLKDLPLFFFFSARDNEISNNIDLKSLFNYLKDNNNGLEISLPQLDNTAVLNIIQEMTSTHNNELKELSTIILSKTNGNPFFITQLITSLYSHGLLYFNLKIQKWEYNINDINNLGYTSNVIDLVVNDIGKLSNDSINIINIASCIGYTFSISLLSKLVNINENVLYNNLVEVMKAGFIQPKHNNITYTKNEDIIQSICVEKLINEFSFVHDKVHEGFYTKMNNNDKILYHYKIGLLLKQTLVNSPPEEIFNVVQHLKKGKTMMKNNDEIFELIDLSLSAAILSKNIGCFKQSLEYGLYARELLLNLYSSIDECWELQYTRIRDISLIICTSGSIIMDINHDKVESYFKFVTGHLKRESEKLEFYLLHARYFVTSELYGDLFNICIQVMDEFGYSIKPNLTIQELDNEIKLTEEKYKSQSIIEYISNQDIIEEKELNLLDFIVETAISIYIVGNIPVYCMMYLVGLRILLKEGIDKNCAPILVGFAFSSQCAFNPSLTSVQYGSLALSLTNQIKHSDKLMSKITFFCGLLSIYSKDYNISLYPKAIEYSCLSYDYGTLGYTLQQIGIYEFLLGKELSYLLNISKERIELGKSKFNRNLDVLIIQGLYECVYLLINGKLPTDAMHPDLYNNVPDLFKSQIYFLQIQTYYILNNTRALELLSIPNVPKGLCAHIELKFFECLIRVKFNPKDFDLIDYIDKTIIEFKSLAKLQQRFKIRLNILKAERLVLLESKSLNIFQYYNNAVEIAKKECSHHLAGIASERAYDFLKKNNYSLGVEGCLDQAINFYKKWGATTKCNILNAQKVKFQAVKRNNSTISSSSKDDNSIHDVILNNVTQLLIHEYETKESLSAFCQIILQQAGVDKGSICYKFKDEIYTLAEWTIQEGLQIYSHPNEKEVIEDIINPIESSSINIVKVKDIKHTLIPYNNILDTIKCGNSEIQQINGGFCIPIQSRNKIVGAVFLENTFVSGVFPMNQTLLKHLICQIISIIERNELNRDLKIALNKEQRKSIMLEKLNKIKDNFVASTSHELRTPLNAILGFTEILKNTSLSQEQEEYCDFIYSAGEGLLTIINDILDFQKCQNNQVTISKSIFNFRRLLDHILRLESINCTNIDICLQLDDNFSSEYWIEGDKLRIQQILLNLLSNAIKFTSKGSVTLSIEIETNTDIIQDIISNSDYNKVFIISIIDTGIGISKEQSNRLFKPFSQLDSGATRKYSGTGLGLVISQNLVKVLSNDKSKIKYKSTINVGSKFYFHLPVKIVKSNETEENIKKLKESYKILDKSIFIIYILKDYYLKQAYLQEIKDINTLEKHFPSSLSEIITQIKDIRQKNTSENIILTLNLSDIENDNNLNDFMLTIQEYQPTIIILSKIKQQSTFHSLVPTIRYPIKFIVKPFYKDIVITSTASLIVQLQSVKDLIVKTEKKPINTLLKDKKESNTLLHDTQSLPKILMVEDNKMNQKMQSRLIKLYKEECDIADNGKEGVNFYLKRIKMNNPYKIILMDFHMPIMDGKEATKIIRNYEKENNIKHSHIIGLTADVFNDFGNMCYCMQKPIKKDKLHKILKKYMNDDCDYK